LTVLPQAGANGRLHIPCPSLGLRLRQEYQFQCFMSHLNMVGSFFIYTLLIIRCSPREVTQPQAHAGTTFNV